MKGEEGGVENIFQRQGLGDSEMGEASSKYISIDFVGFFYDSYGALVLSRRDITFLIYRNVYSLRGCSRTEKHVRFECGGRGEEAPKKCLCPSPLPTG